MEPVLTNQVVSLTIAMMMSLGQWLGDGVEAYRKQEYEAASKAFTRVIESEIQPNPLRETALLLRAQSRLQEKKTDEAIADIERLLKENPRSALFRLAVADYKKMTGKDWGGINLSTPESTWRSLIGAVRKGDAEGLKRCCTGELLAELLELMEDEPEGLQEIAEEIGNTELIGVTMNSVSNKARIIVSEGPELHDEQGLVMKLVDGCWLLAEEYDEDDFLEFEAGQAVAGRAVEDLNKLRMIDGAMEMYVLEYDRPPAAIEDIGEYIKDFNGTVVSASDGKPFVFAVPRNGSMPWVFAATSVNGQRHGVIDGQVRDIPEQEFIALAKKMGIRVPGGVEAAVDVTEEEAAEIRGLIKQLGAGVHAERAAAMERLREFGARARGLLKEAMDDDDPEIVFRAGKLLSEP